MKLLFAIFILAGVIGTQAAPMRLEWNHDSKWTTNATLHIYHATKIEPAVWHRLASIPATNRFYDLGPADWHGEHFFKMTVTDFGVESDFSNVAKKSDAKLSIR